MEMVVHSKKSLIQQKFQKKLYHFNRNSQFRSVVSKWASGVGQKNHTPTPSVVRNPIPYGSDSATLIYGMHYLLFRFLRLTSKSSTPQTHHQPFYRDHCWLLLCQASSTGLLPMQGLHQILLASQRLYRTASDRHHCLDNPARPSKVRDLSPNSRCHNRRHLVVSQACLQVKLFCNKSTCTP